jgi:hypothetical protein
MEQGANWRYDDSENVEKVYLSSSFGIAYVFLRCLFGYCILMLSSYHFF